MGLINAIIYILYNVPQKEKNEMKQESKKYHETKPGSIQDAVMQMQVNEQKSVTVKVKELSALIETYLNKGGVSHNLSPVIAEEKLSEVLPLQAVREFIDTYNRHFLTNYKAEEFIECMRIVQDIIDNPETYVGAQAIKYANILAAYRTVMIVKSQAFKRKSAVMNDQDKFVNDIWKTMYEALAENINALKLAGKGGY